MQKNYFNGHPCLIRLSFSALLGTLLLVGCGSETSPQETPGEGPACTSGFVSDYNKVVMSTWGLMDAAKIAESRGLAEQFKTKYKGVTCRMSFRYPGHLDDTVESVNADAKMDSIIAALDKL